MTLYDLLHQVAEKLTKEHSEELYDYLLHSMDDDGGFLRTRWCMTEKTLENFKVGKDIRTVLLTLKYPFDFAGDTVYFETDEDGYRRTRLKLQLFYYDLSDEESCQEEVMWSEQVGFRHPVRIDITSS